MKSMMRKESHSKNRPTVSVVMPVFNAERYVAKAIDSICSQTLGDLELIIIDDGSTDGSWEIITAAAAKDNRIRPFRNERNRGLIWTLNRGLARVRGRYVARMDADDIALPNRLARQISFMEERGLYFCGTWIRLIGIHRPRIIRYPVTDLEFKTALLFQTPFSHPTLVMKRELIDKGFRYRNNAVHAEEYDLAVRLSPWCRMGNAPEVLLHYRMHTQQVSKVYRQKQLETAANIRREALRNLGIIANESQMELHARIRYPAPVENLLELLAFREWLEILADHFHGHHEAQRIVAEQWFRVCVRATVLGPQILVVYRKSPLLAHYKASFRQKADLLLASLLRLRYGGRIFTLLEQLSLSPGF